jgi:beta-lactam-binding protein with PASTA domain
MMASEPADRPSAAEVARSVETLGQQPTVVLPVSSVPSARAPSQWDRRHVVAIVAAAALVLTIGTVVVVLQGDDATPPARAGDLVVPSVRGEPVATAASDLDAAGLEVVRRFVDGPTPRGEVLGQSPGPGTYTGEEPATVVLQVSSGWVTLDGDDLHDTTYAAAARTVSDLGLTPMRVDQPSSTGVGTVLVIDPDGRVRVGSTVTLTVATAEVVAPPPSAHHPGDEPGKPKKPKPGKPAEPGKPGKMQH